jgi:hypothetical protein
MDSRRGRKLNIYIAKEKARKEIEICRYKSIKGVLRVDQAPREGGS